MIEKWLQYTCNGCGDTETADAANATAKEVRARIRDYGWRSRGALDYCPVCVDSGIMALRITDFSA